MSLADDQILLLEEYLDGALPASEAAEVRGRIESDPAWTSTAHQLRADRAFRQNLFRELEPDDVTAARLADRVLEAIRFRRRSGGYGQIFRITGAAAACLVVGGLGGWLLHDRSVATNHFTTGAARPVAASERDASHLAAAVAYQVELTDEAGRVTAVQKFDSLEKAHEFADDLSRWQDRQRQLRNGAAVVVADQF